MSENNNLNEFYTTEDLMADIAEAKYQEEREKMLKERREEHLRSVKAKRRITAGLLIGLIALSLCFLIFLGGRKLLKTLGPKIFGDSQSYVNQVPEPESLAQEDALFAEAVESVDPDTDASSDPEEEPEETFVGKNPTLTEEGIFVGDDILIFPGYKPDFGKNPLPFAEEGVIYSTHGILIDAKTGEVLRSTGGDEKIYPASMTKILTVLTAAEHITEDQLDDPVTITIDETDFVFRNDLSAVNFSLGETVTVRDLFYGTILPSGGDAAMALAKYVAGDVDTFVGMMNEKAAELGLSRTSHFSNVVGLYEDDNYSTCADIAMILKAALENDFCYEVLHAHRYTTSSTEEHPEGIEISNWFLRRIEDHYTEGEVLCAKTGFVVESRNCAASFARTENGGAYLCVTADGGNGWQAIFDHVYAYAEYAE